jgi:hypothetical protein
MMLETSMALPPAHRKSPRLRTFAIDDYDEVRALWESIMSDSLSDADSRDGVRRFLERNPGMSLVAVHEGAIVGAVLGGHDGRRGLIHHQAVTDSAGATCSCSRTTPPATDSGARSAPWSERSWPCTR